MDVQDYIYNASYALCSTNSEMMVNSQDCDKMSVWSWNHSKSFQAFFWCFFHRIRYSQFLFFPALNSVSFMDWGERSGLEQLCEATRLAMEGRFVCWIPAYNDWSWEVYIIYTHWFVAQNGIWDPQNRTSITEYNTWIILHCHLVS